MFIFAALIAGVAIGYFVPRETPANPPPQVVETAELSRLRARVAELEAKLVEAPLTAADVQDSATNRVSFRQ